MADNKPSLEQITKGLKICTSVTGNCSNGGKCTDCYLCGHPMCAAILHQDAIDFMNAQNAKISEHDNSILQLLRESADPDTATAQYEKCLRENQRAEYLKKLEDRITELEHEKFALLEHEKLVSAEKIESTKCEIVNHIYSKIKSHMYYIDHPKQHRVIDEDDINNIMKEVGEYIENM